MPTRRARPSSNAGAMPYPGDDNTNTTWVVGWVRIESQQTSATSTTVQLTHEGIEADIARRAIENKVFDVLDGTGKDKAPVEPEASEESEKASASPARRGRTRARDRAPNGPPSQSAAEAEFERRMQEAKRRAAEAEAAE